MGPGLTPHQPCVNREQGNSVDVCCRDPNYKDPWPGGMVAGGGGAPPAPRQPPRKANKKRPNNAKKQSKARPVQPAKQPVRQPARQPAVDPWPQNQVYIPYELLN